MSNPVRVARFSSVSVIASGFVKLVFKNEIAAWRSPSPNELTICSVVGVAEGEALGKGDGDPPFAADGIGVGLSPKATITNKNEMAVTTARLSIVFIVTCWPRSEQYLAGNGSHRS